MKKNNLSVKRIFTAVGALLLMLLMPVTDAEKVQASEPFASYYYDSYKEAVATPYPYLYGATVTPDETSFSFPKDLFYYDGSLYVADTGNNRILIMDEAGKVIKEITSAKSSSDLFNKPEGVYVTEEGHIYVADSGNYRIVEYDGNCSFVREIVRPDSTLIPDNAEFKPTKVVVDKAGRIYTICYGINMGLVEFDKNGEFKGYMGATEVNVSLFRYIWKNYLATDEQKLRMKTIIPTEYSNIFVDKSNFVYATINNLSEDDHRDFADAIRRLNPTGTDVLRRLGNEIVGELDWSDNDYSSFADVAATDYGCYFVLDDANGRIFAYDYDGNNLFAFGRKGIREGNVNKPTSLVINDDASFIYVLDSVPGGIIRFDITDYGKNVLDALYLNDRGDSEGSNACWQKVLKANANSELAYIGLGKTYLDEGDYKKAMEYFKLGNSKKYYSKAFYYHRKEVMEEWFSKGMLIIGIVLLLILGFAGFRKFKVWKGKVKCFMEKH